RRASSQRRRNPLVTTRSTQMSGRDRSCSRMRCPRHRFRLCCLWGSPRQKQRVTPLPMWPGGKGPPYMTIGLSGSRVGTVVLAATLLTSSSGCANFNSIYRKFDVNKGTSVSIDVKQRVVLSAKRRDDHTGGGVTVTCAEPSPDALSA